MDQRYLDLIYSERVFPRTRQVLVQRMEESTDVKQKAICPEVYPVLQAALARLVPQTDRTEPIDIAARLDEQHFLGQGNGWRYADMPTDQEALELGLRLLEKDARREYGQGFAALDPEQQELMLTQVQTGDVRWSALNPKRWFEELLTDATAIFVSHPDTLAAIGFSGIAIQPGWKKIGLNEGETWEPRAR